MRIQEEEEEEEQNMCEGGCIPVPQQDKVA